MTYSNRHPTGMPNAGNRVSARSRTVSHRDWDDDAAPAAMRRGRALLPILLVIALAVASIAFSPTTAAMCAKLDDFPCGP